MRRLLPLFTLLLFIAPIQALEPTADPNLATVRIKSHGASGTIIATSEGKSWILGCAHMFMDFRDNSIDPELAQKRLRIDGPVQPYAPKSMAEAKLIAADPHLDLCLIVIENGPFHYLPVAKIGHKPSYDIRSIGYDEMAWPITNQHATILITGANWTHTREKPWHGRSGGGLIDAEARVLIGVVHGYETRGQKRGIYVSHEAVLRFLETHMQGHQYAPHTTPSPAPRQRYASPGDWRPILRPFQPPCPQRL